METRRVGKLVFAGCLVLLLLPLTGVGSPQRLGWGLDPHLNIGPLQEAISDLELSGTAHCVDATAAGMLAWLAPGDLRPYDHPARALLAGRLEDNVLLDADLAAGRRFRYRRSDGSAGGYWLALDTRRTSLLLIPARRADLMQGLLQSDFLTSTGTEETGIWRPLAVGSLMVPLGRADGPPAVRRRILQIEGAHHALAWRYWPELSPPVGGSDTHVDLWGLISRQADTRTMVEEASLLRAMQRPVSAVRFLTPMLRRATVAARREFLACQVQLAYEERQRTGRVSQFRREVVRRLLKTTPASRQADVLAALEEDNTFTSKASARFVQGVATYVAGDPAAAEDLLSNGSDAETFYALGWLRIESGQPQRAAETFTQLQSEFPKHHLVRMARYVLQFLPSPAATSS